LALFLRLLIRPEFAYLHHHGNPTMLFLWREYGCYLHLLDRVQASLFNQGLLHIKSMIDRFLEADTIPSLSDMTVHHGLISYYTDTLNVWKLDDSISKQYFNMLNNPSNFSDEIEKLLNLLGLAKQMLSDDSQTYSERNITVMVLMEFLALFQDLSKEEKLDWKTLVEEYIALRKLPSLNHQQKLWAKAIQIQLWKMRLQKSKTTREWWTEELDLILQALQTVRIVALRSFIFVTPDDTQSAKDNNMNCFINISNYDLLDQTISSLETIAQSAVIIVECNTTLDERLFQRDKVLFKSFLKKLTKPLGDILKQNESCLKQIIDNIATTCLNGQLINNSLQCDQLKMMMRQVTNGWLCEVDRILACAILIKDNVLVKALLPRVNGLALLIK
jgi:hypothetical protein